MAKRKIKAKKSKAKREYKKKVPPWMTGDVRCRECVHFDPSTSTNDLGRCSLLSVYREPEEWCERANRKKD